MLIFSTVIWIKADPTRRLKIRAQTTLHTHYTTMTELRRQTAELRKNWYWKPYVAAGSKLQPPGLEAKNHHMAMQPKRKPKTKTFKYCR